MKIRNLVEPDDGHNEDDAMDWRTSKFGKKSSHHKYKNQVMLSEWLVEVPHDFAENWLFVFCPKGT